MALLVGGDTDPAGPATGSGEGEEGYARVRRGGGWGHDAYYATVYYREDLYADHPYHYVGFRLARSIP